jgi:hypothetical protein
MNIKNIGYFAIMDPEVGLVVEMAERFVPAHLDYFYSCLNLIYLRIDLPMFLAAFYYVDRNIINI